MPPSMYVLLSRAELVVRELEKEAVKHASQQQAAAHDASQPLERFMMRSVACFIGQGVAFVDTAPPLWQALHCNIALSDVRRCWEHRVVLCL